MLTTNLMSRLSQLNKHKCTAQWDKVYWKVCVCVCVCIYIYIYIYTHIYNYVWTYIFTHLFLYFLSTTAFFALLPCIEGISTFPTLFFVLCRLFCYFTSPFLHFFSSSTFLSILFSINFSILLIPYFLLLPLNFFPHSFP